MFKLAGRLLKACARDGMSALWATARSARYPRPWGKFGFLQLRNAPDVITALLNDAIRTSMFMTGVTPFIEVADQTTVLKRFTNRSIEGEDQIR